MGARMVTNGGGPPQGERLAFDPDAVIEQLAQQVGFLSAQLAIRESVIERLRGELAAAQGAAPTEGKVRVPASKEA